jgi:hypothetical protein
MDENGFIDFMRNAKRSEGTILRYVAFMKVFEKFIKKQGKTLENATPVDFDSFLKVADPKYRSFSFVSGVRNYYDFIGNDRMKYVLDELDYERPQPYNLSRHIGVNQVYVTSLVSLGIKTSRDLVQAAKTEEDRLNLVERTGIPVEELTALVKLSDLSRKWGPKRARLYFDAGYDTFDKVAAMEPVEFRKRIIEYVKKTGIKFSPPTPSEANSAVQGARRRPRIVEY